MNVFDFDNTLYRGDCTLDFWRFAIVRNPVCLLDVPAQVLAAAGYALGRLTKEEFKQSFYRFLKRLDDPEGLVAEFWDSSMRKLNKDVLSYANEGDLVVSASPSFLLRLPCQKLGLSLIASEVDISTGRLEGPNCYGATKVDRIRAEGFPLHYEKGFSDSLSDMPMLSLANEPYIVNSGRISPVDLFGGI